MIVLLKLYQNWISPFFHHFFKMIGGNPYSGCKFEPTCSCYFEQAIKKHGSFRGSIKGLKRILKCHPFNKARGYDPL